MSLQELRSARLDTASLAIRAGSALATRQVVVQSANILGGIALARTLTVAEFGLWSLVSFLFSAVASIAGGGLGTSLIRHSEAPTARDERSVLAAQQGFAAALGLLGAGAVFLAASVAGRSVAPDTAAALPWFLLALLVSFFQTVPAARLERSMRFDRLALIEMSQALVHNGAMVILAVAGASIHGLAVALLTRSVVGAVLAHRAAPWPVGWALDIPRLRTHLQFGLPFQGAVLLSTAKDSLTPVFVGLVAGTAAVGTISWAQMAAAFPVLGLMILQRVYLPLFSRARDAGRDLVPVVEAVVASANLIVAPLAVIALALHRPLIREVFGEPWLAAIPVFLLLWPANLGAATVTPLLALLNALGRAPLALSYSLIWAVGTWALAAPLVVMLGPTGYGWANLIIQLTNIPLIRQARAIVPFRLGASIGPAWAAAAAMGSVLWVLNVMRPADSLPSVALYSVTGLGIYAAGLAIAFPGLILELKARLREGSA